MITGRWAFAGQVNSSLGELDDRVPPILVAQTPRLRRAAMRHWQADSDELLFTLFASFGREKAQVILFSEHRPLVVVPVPRRAGRA